jgi:type IV secretion system protein TrbC
LETRKQTNKWMRRAGYGLGMATIVWPAMAIAAVAGGTMPWDPTLTALQTDMQGPVAHTITTAAVIGTGLMWGVSEHGTGIRKVSGVAFGGALALGATVFMNAAFGAGALF